MAGRQISDVIIEDARLLFRNFGGAEGKYNSKGERNFNVALNDDVAERMLQDGWNVKYLNPREEGDEPQAILKVKINFGGRPPKIVMVTSRGKTSLAEDMIAILDWAEIIKSDLIIRPYEWDINGNQGITAYLKSIYVTIREDALEQKYANVPDSAQNILVMEPEE